MIEPDSVASQQQVVETMIDLTRLAHSHRAIIAGSDSLELYLALRRRGFVHVATTATCRIPKRQHSVGLINGRHSPVAIEAALTEISQFLCTSAAIAVLIDSRESGACLKIRAKLEQMGFRIEAGGQVPAGPGALRLSTGFHPDRTGGVTTNENSCMSRHLADGHHT